MIDLLLIYGAAAVLLGMLGLAKFVGWLLHRNEPRRPGDLTEALRRARR